MSSIAIAESLVTAAAVYIACGLGFAAAFLTFGISRIDPAARSSTYGFRALILPGTVALWPLLAVRWIRGGSRPFRSTAHRAAAGLEQSR